MEDTRKLPFEKINSLDTLSRHLGVPSSWLVCLENDTDRSGMYAKLSLNKKSGKGFREIVYAEDETLQDVQKIIFEALSSIISFPKSVNGFVQKKSIVTNATPHLGKNLILKIDLKDFFNQFTIEMVKEVFIEVKCTESIALLLAKVCTYEGTLVQGFVTSPIISNASFLAYDNKIQSFLDNKYPHVVYTRYADDLTFSTDSSLPSYEEIESILVPFVVNKEKVITMRKGNKQYVTGLSISDSSSPRVPRRYKRNTRLLLYNLMKSSTKINSKEELNYIKGEWYELKSRINYIRMVEKESANKYFIDLNLIREQIRNQGYSVDNKKEITETLVVDNA